MATQTTNLHLVKPAGNENADVGVINGNMNIIDTAVSNKVDKVTGKGLSTNDYTTAEQTKLENLNANIIIATNKAVAVADFVADTTYEDYPYKANISVTGATTDYYPEVVFGVTEANSGNYAPVSSTGSGVVTIYAVEPPSEAITIPTIKLEKVVS